MGNPIEGTPFIVSESLLRDMTARYKMYKQVDHYGHRIKCPMCSSDKDRQSLNMQHGSANSDGRSTDTHWTQGMQALNLQKKQGSLGSGLTCTQLTSTSFINPSRFQTKVTPNVGVGAGGDEVAVVQSIVFGLLQP
jgi:hypothetical protein